jgi:hypothetical protein
MTELAGKGNALLKYEVALRQQNGGWTAVVQELRVHASAVTAIEARSMAQAHALRRIADQIETDRSAPDKISFAVWLE